jgi:acetyltransferase-like isoleucine patch superfamily enzyme
MASPADHSYLRPAVESEGAVVGHPSPRGLGGPLVLGPGALLRSGTVIYEASSIGARFETGHNVVVREECAIGDDVSVWSNTVIDYGCVIGDRVKIHCNGYIAQFTELQDDAFLAPGVTIANDLFPGDEASARAMAGPLIGEGAQIGVNVTILPYVRIGAGAIIGAGSVVTRDIPPGTIAFGNPAVPVRSVDDVRDVEERVRRARRSRFRPTPQQLDGNGAP